MEGNGQITAVGVDVACCWNEFGGVTGFMGSMRETATHLLPCPPVGIAFCDCRSGFFSPTVHTSWPDMDGIGHMTAVGVDAGHCRIRFVLVIGFARPIRNTGSYLQPCAVSE